MTIFSYVDLTNRVVTVSTDHLPWRGAWTSGGTYQVGDWVSRAGDDFIALAASTNAAPNTSPLSWSILVPRHIIPEPVVTDQLYTSTTVVNPNGTVVPTDVTVGNAFYHEANGSVDYAWWWSASTGTWYPNTTAQVVSSLNVGVGTVPYRLAVGGSITYDFSGPAYQVTTVDGNLHVSIANMAPGREIAVLLKPGAATSTLEFPAEFVWFGTTPPPSIVNKNVLIALTSLGTGLDILAASSISV